MKVTLNQIIRHTTALEFFKILSKEFKSFFITFTREKIVRQLIDTQSLQLNYV